MSNHKTNICRICSQCGFIDGFGVKTNCPYCQFNLITIEHSFFDIAFNIFNNNKTIPTIEEIETKYVKNSPYFRQELWDKRKKQESENRQIEEERKQNLGKSNMSICRTCGCLYKGRPASCNYCKSSHIAELDITGAYWEAIPAKKRQNKKRRLLVDYCYKYDGFNREKWKQRIFEHENRKAWVAKIFNRNQDSYTEDYRDYLLTLGEKCPVCYSDQIQVARQFGPFVAWTKMICLKCKKIY